jgi:hypothetical protein
LLTMEALGRLMTSALPVPLVVVEILKLLPAVPVAMLLTRFWGMLTTRALPVPLVEVETENTSLTAVVVETLLIMLEGRLKVITEGEVAVEILNTSPTVVVLMPIEPVSNPKEVTPPLPQSLPVPETTPEALACRHWVPDWTLPRTKELMVVEPVSEATDRKEEPVTEATWKIGRTWAEVEATTSKVAATGVEELIIKDLAVLSHRKLEVPAVVVAAE